MQEQGISNQEAFEEIQEMDMEDWAAINDMADRYDAETLKEVEYARDIIPREDLEPIEKSVKDLTKAMDSYRETEQNCGHPQEKTWKDFQEQHWENKYNIQQYRETYQRGEALPVKEAAAKEAIESLRQSATYFETQRKGLQEKYQLEIAESQNNQEAFEEIQEMDMEDWAAIDDMAEQYYAETVREVEDARDTIPREDLEPVEKSAKDLTKAMDSYRETEQDCGHPQKKTWKGYQKQHQENKENIRQYRETYQKGEALPVKEAAGKKATESLSQSAAYFETQRKELQEKYQLEIAESQKERKALQKEVSRLKDVIHDLRESARKNELQLTMGYQECVAGYEALQERVEATQKRFWYVKKFRKDMADTIKETYDKVKDTPRRVKEAVENTACAVIDDAYTKTAGVFYKTGQKIDQKRDQTLEHTRYWTEKRPEREEKKAQQRAAVYIRAEGPEREEGNPLEVMRTAQVGPLEKAPEREKGAVYTQAEGQDRKPLPEKGKAAHTLNGLKEGVGKAPEESAEKKAPEKAPYSREAIQELSEELNQQKQKLQEDYKEWRQHFQHTDLPDRTESFAIRDDMGPLEIMQAAQVGLPERSREQAPREEAVNVQTAEKTTKVQQTVTVEKEEPNRTQTAGHDIQKPPAGRHYVKNGRKGPDRKGAER